MLTNSEQIIAKIVSSNGIGRRELAKELALDVRTVTNYTGQLEEQGFIVRHLTPIKFGRPVYKYFKTDKKLFFASIILTSSGIFGAMTDSDGKLRAQINIKEFSAATEIPMTAAKKVIKLLSMMESDGQLKANALTLVFSRMERPGHFANEICSFVDDNLRIPVFAESPISVHAYDFKMRHPEYQKILFLHFGFSLELAVIDGDCLSPESEKLSESFAEMPIGNDILWHNVSLSSILDSIAALDGRCFYHMPDLIAKISSRDQRAMKIILAKERIIKQAINRIAAFVEPDTVVVLALPADIHLLAMPEISGQKLKIKCNGKILPYQFWPRTENKNMPLLLAAAATAEYRSWRKYFASNAQK